MQMLGGRGGGMGGGSGGGGGESRPPRDREPGEPVGSSTEKDDFDDDIPF
jgi:hypothetical protein